ncbi:hypothetical protein D3C72_2149420 [compost metagenome]
MPPATRAADLVLISTSAWLAKSTVVGAGETADWVQLPGSEAPTVRPFLPCDSSIHWPLPSALNLATYSVPVSRMLALAARLFRSNALLGTNL